jgi:hypothetical protein
VSLKALSCVTLKGSAAELGEIPNASVDFIFTDPPFGSNIFYSDCSILWESWLGELTDTTKEAVWNKSRAPKEGGKTLDDYGALMAGAFREMFRVLKPGRWCAVEFNNSDGAVFEVIKKAVTDAGFEIVNMLLLDKEQKSFKQVKGAKGEEDVVDKDVLFNLRKPSIAGVATSTDDRDLDHQIADIVREHLASLPQRIKIDPGRYTEDHRTTATINSMLMNALIPQSVRVERLNLPFIERVCSRYFRKVGQRWYLRGEAVGNQHGPSGLLEEEATIKDEISAIEWIRQRLKAGPALIGELKPLWMRATGLLPVEVSQTLVLEDLLLDNFWKDADTNRWREPTDEERERMNDDRSLRVLHDAERFVAGTLSRKTTDAERCGWIDILFTACKAVEDNEEAALPALRGFDPREGYRLISRLFQNVLREKVTPAVYTRAEKQARVASQRLSKDLQAETERAKVTPKKDEQPSLFDSKSSK